MRRRAVWLPAVLSLLVGVACAGSQPTLTTAAPKPAETSVYVTETGKKYHLDGCRYLRQSKIAMKLSEARKRYDPCSVCRPPR